MTVPVNSRRRTHIGDGTTVTFNGPMAYLSSDVSAFVDAGGTGGQVAISSVSRLGREGGTVVTLAAAPPAGSTLTLLRTVPLSQTTDITNQGAFLPETLEKGLDLLAMQIQQLDDGSLGMEAEGGAFVWDAKGMRIVRVGDGINDTDAVNMRTLLLAVQGSQSGSSGVVPKFWEITGNGSDTDFDLSGADVSDLLFYDVVLAGLSKEPFDEYTIVPSAGSSGFAIRFSAAPADEAQGFVILRGYAKPYSGPTPVQTLRIPIIDVSGTAFAVDKASEFALLRTTAGTLTTLTIGASQAGGLGWGDGSYFSVAQRGAGQALIAPADGVALVVPSGFQARTRAAGSIISAVCEYADGNTWIISGDLAED